MLLSIETARSSLPNSLIAYSAGSLVSACLFFFSVFGDIKNININLLFLSIFFGFLGFILACHYVYRSNWGSANALVGLIYLLLVSEIMLVGGAASLTVFLAGRAELRLLAVITTCITLIVSIFFGMQRSAGKVKLWNADILQLARDRFSKNINYSDKKFTPYPIVNIENQSNIGLYGYLIIGVGITNIPLLFKVFTGEQSNAIFIAFPVLLGVFVYLNVKTIGGGVLNILLLRKLEKSLGYCFINADYEQIQELRRTFFLSRWLMKDYVKPTNTTTVANEAVKRK